MPWHELPQIDGAGGHRTAAGPLIRRLAALQHGVAARWQLLALGVSPHNIGHRTRRGELIAVLPGVYAVGHDRLTADGRRMAAVLAAGPGSVASGRTAAAMHGLRATSSGLIEVTSPRRARTIAGTVRAREARALHPDDRTLVGGVPVTSVCRTLVDNADLLTPQALDSLFAQAELLQLDITGLDAAVARVRGRRGPGPARLREARARLAAHGVVLTRSQGEELLLRVLADGGLPAPVTNFRVHGDEVDAVWPALMAGIELDSWRYHRGRYRFVRDRAKLRRLTLAGYTILPYPAFDLMDHPELVVTETGALLARRRAAAM